MLQRHTPQAFYYPGSYLMPHLDRAQCEYSASIQLATEPAGHLWGLAVDNDLKSHRDGTKVVGPAAPGRESIMYLDEGDMAVIEGRLVNHYRDSVLAHNRSGHLFLHWVYTNFTGSLN